MPAELEALSLDELRDRRDDLQREEETVSYRRRLLHAQLDIVAATAESGGADSHADGVESVVARALLDQDPESRAGAIRAVDVNVFDDDVEPLPPDLVDLDAEQRAALLERLRAAEEEASSRRRELLAELDALQAEIVRRFRRDGVDLEALLREGS